METLKLVQPKNMLKGAAICSIFSIAAVFLYLWVCSRRARLSHIPGPFLARYTDAWGVYAAWTTNRNSNRLEFQRQLQAKYGDVVRTGPRSITVFDSRAVPTIYGLHSRLDKGEAYIPFRQVGVANTLVSIGDEATHSKYRKLVSNAYSMTSLKAYEPYVNDILNRFVEVCDEHSRAQKPMNISLWCQYYCFDVVSKLTLGKPLGFLEGNDTFGLIRKIQAFGFYLELVTQMPWLHKVFQDNPIFRTSQSSPFLSVIKNTIQARLRKPDPKDQPRPDLLSHFVATHGDYPDLMDDKYVAISASGNLVAGGLSPGKAFDCLCHFLVLYPEVQDRIYAELQEAQFFLPITYDQAKSLPYLDGTIREAYRFNTSALANLQRVTGATGLELPNGVQVPPRTNIGCSVSMVNHDSRIFGDDCDTFRPERWMQGKDEIYEDYIERKKRMERYDLTFGHGSRSCIGKNIAALEFFKAVATLMSQYKFELAGELKKGEVIVTIHRRETGLNSA